MSRPLNEKAGLMSFALRVQRAMPKPMVANPGETVYIGGLPFTIYTSGRGIVRYRSTETRWEKVFKVLKDESVAALEARIAADLADLGIVVGTPRGLAAECATQAETSASSRPARQSGDKAKRYPEVHTGARAPSAEPAGRRHPDGTMPPPAQRRSPGLSSIMLPPSLADVQRPSADEAEPSQRSMRSGPSASATQQPAEDPVPPLRKARKTLVDIDRLQQKAASGAALSSEELAKLTQHAHVARFVCRLWHFLTCPRGETD